MILGYMLFYGTVCCGLLAKSFNGYFSYRTVNFWQTGQRTANILKHLFPVPKPDTKRIITFANQADYISFRLVSCAAEFLVSLLSQCLF